MAHPQETDHNGDVTDVRVIRRVEQHPQAWRLWQPFIIKGDKKAHLIVAFGAMRNGKKDMGDILVTLSKNDGDTWQTPVVVFDHTKRQGAIQFAYANPVLHRPSGQTVIWCFAMRCPITQRNSEESQLVGAFSADWGRSWTPVEMAMQYTGPLILNAGITETEIKGKKRFLLPAHRNTLAADPRGSRDHSFSAAPASWNGNWQPTSHSPAIPAYSCTKEILETAIARVSSRSSCAPPTTTKPI